MSHELDAREASAKALFPITWSSCQWVVMRRVTGSGVTCRMAAISSFAEAGVPVASTTMTSESFTMIVELPLTMLRPGSVRKAA